MVKPKHLSPDELRQLLSYDEATGRLYWLPRGPESNQTKYWNKQHAGKEALTAVNSDGYRVGHIHDVIYRAHRVIWAMCKNEWPHRIGYIDGDKLNNRIGNLAEVTNHQIQRNQRRRCTNTSGVTGVIFKRGKWIARITVDGAGVHLGMFTNIEDAAKARELAEKKYGFSPLHGKDILTAVTRRP